MDVSYVGGSAREVSRPSQSEDTQKVERIERSARDDDEQRARGEREAAQSDPGASAGRNVDIRV